MTVFFTRPQIGLFFSHGDPLAGLTRSPCFPLKSHSAAVLLGAMRVNISISIESVLFLEVQCFLGLLCSHSTQVVCWTPKPLPPHPCIYIPLWQTKTKLESRSLFFSPARTPEKTKQRCSSLLCGEAVGESVCVCFCLIAYAASEQTSRREAQTNRETCIKSEIVWEGYDRCLYFGPVLKCDLAAVCFNSCSSPSLSPRPPLSLSVSSVRFLSHDARIWDGSGEQRTSQSKWRLRHGGRVQGGTTQECHAVSGGDGSRPPASPAAPGRPVAPFHTCLHFIKPCQQQSVT